MNASFRADYAVRFGGIADQSEWPAFAITRAADAIDLDTTQP